EEKYGRGSRDSLANLIDGYAGMFSLNTARRNRVEIQLAAWQQEVRAATRPANLVKEYYELLAECGIADWDLANPRLVARLGALARCSMILADYESVRRRSRPDDNAP